MPLKIEIDVKSNRDDSEGVDSLLDESTPNEGNDAKKTVKKSRDLGERPARLNRTNFNIKCNDKRYSAFTLTLKNVYREYWKERDIDRLVYNTLNGWGYLYYGKFDFELMPDIDDNGNYHYHGLIRITRQLLPKFKRNITRVLGFIKVVYITTPNDWEDYCYKRNKYKDKNVYSESEILERIINKDYIKNKKRSGFNTETKKNIKNPMDYEE